MKTQVTFTISRNSNDEINIRVKDCNSGLEFVDAIMGMEAYAQLITGLSHVEATAELRSLENVGKYKVRENRSVVCPFSKTRSRANQQVYLKEQCKERGWIVDSYLGSQGSVTTNKDGDTVLNYSVYKFVEEKPE